MTRQRSAYSAKKLSHIRPLKFPGGALRKKKLRKKKTGHKRKRRSRKQKGGFLPLLPLAGIAGSILGGLFK